MFFFGSFEGYKRTQSLFTEFSVPSEALRRGDFSGAVVSATNSAQQTIYNPNTGNADGSGRQAFANNQIPTNMINPIALRILELFPMPNQPGIGAGGLTTNYRREETRTVDRDNYDFKLNWNRTSAHQIWGKYSYMDAVVDDLTNYLGPDPNAEGDGGFTKVYQFTTGQTWTLSPTLLMDQTFGFSMQDQEVLGPDFNAGNFGLDVLGIPGTNDQGIGDQRYAGYPQFNTGFSALGNRDGWNPIFRDERTYSIATNLTKLAGRHDIRGGYFLNFLYLDHWQPETGNPRGNFTFNGNTTGLRGGQTTNFYNQFASFLLGYVGNVEQERAERADDVTRVAARALRPRSVERQLQTDARSRPALGVLPDHAQGRRPRSRSPRSVEPRRHRGGPRWQPADQRDERRAGQLRAARWRHLPPQRQDGRCASGYGLTYNAQAWARAVRGDNDYPVTIASTFINPEQFAYYGTLQQGIPTIVGPDISDGRVPLDRAAAEYTPEIDNIDRGYVHTWNVAFERRLPYDISVDVAYVGAKGTGGYAALDINAPQTLGGGDNSRPYASFGRFVAVNSWGQRLKTRYNSLQVALNKPFTHGLMFKGAYTLSKAMNESDNDGRATLTWNTPSELFRNWAPAGFDRRHNFQLGFAYALPWQNNGSGYDGIGSAIISDWQINGVLAVFSGTPFTVTASGTSLNTPANQQMADLVGTYNVTGEVAPNVAWFETAAFAQPTGVRFGNTGRNQFYGPGGYNLDFSIFRVFPVGGSRKLEARWEVANLTNNEVFGNPQGNVTSGTFGQITGINGNYPERMMRLAVRFSF